MPLCPLCPGSPCSPLVPGIPCKHRAMPKPLDPATIPRAHAHTLGYPTERRGRSHSVSFWASVTIAAWLPL